MKHQILFVVRNYDYLGNITTFEYAKWSDGKWHVSCSY